MDDFADPGAIPGESTPNLKEFMRVDKVKPSQAKYVKNRLGRPLKAAARALGGKDKQVLDWFFNKRANTKKAPLGVGATRRKKGSQNRPASPPRKKPSKELD